MKQAEDLGQPIELPELGPLYYMAEAMMRIGPVKSDGMTSRATGWQEIEPFARATMRINTPWEAETLFDMCAAYFEDLQAGESPFRIEPVGR